MQGDIMADELKMWVYGIAPELVNAIEKAKARLHIADRALDDDTESIPLCDRLLGQRP